MASVHLGCNVLYYKKQLKTRILRGLGVEILSIGTKFMEKKFAAGGLITILNKKCFWYPFLSLY